MRLTPADLTNIAASIQEIDAALHGQFTVRRADIVIAFTADGEELGAGGVLVSAGWVAGALVILDVTET